MNGFYEASLLCGVNANNPKLSLQLAKVKQDLQKVLSSDKEAIQVHHIDNRLNNPVRLSLKLSQNAAYRLHQVAALNSEALKRLGVLAVRLTGASLPVQQPQQPLPAPGTSRRHFLSNATLHPMNIESSSGAASSYLIEAPPNSAMTSSAGQFYQHSSAMMEESQFSAAVVNAEMYNFQQQQQPSTSYGSMEQYHTNAVYNEVQQYGEYPACGIMPDNGNNVYGQQLVQQQQQVYYNEQGWQMQHHHQQQQQQFVNGEEAAYWNYQQQHSQEFGAPLSGHYNNNNSMDPATMPIDRTMMQRARMMHPGQNNSPLLVNLLQQQSPPASGGPPPAYYQPGGAPTGQTVNPPRKRRRNTASSDTNSRAPRKTSAKALVKPNNEQHSMMLGGGGVSLPLSSSSHIDAFACPSPLVAASHYHAAGGTLSSAPPYCIGSSSQHGFAQQQQQLGDSPYSSQSSIASPLKPHMSTNTPQRSSPPLSSAASFSSPGSSLGGAATPGPAAPSTTRDASINSVIDSVMLRVIAPVGASPGTSGQQVVTMAAAMQHVLAGQQKFSGKNKGADLTHSQSLAKTQKQKIDSMLQQPPINSGGGGDFAPTGTNMPFAGGGGGIGASHHPPNAMSAQQSALYGGGGHHHHFSQTGHSGGDLQQQHHHAMYPSDATPMDHAHAFPQVLQSDATFNGSNCNYSAGHWSFSQQQQQQQHLQQRPPDMQMYYATAQQQTASQQHNFHHAQSGGSNMEVPSIRPPPAPASSWASQQMSPTSYNSNSSNSNAPPSVNRRMPPAMGRSPAMASEHVDSATSSAPSVYNGSNVGVAMTGDSAGRKNIPEAPSWNLQQQQASMSRSNVTSVHAGAERMRFSSHGHHSMSHVQQQQQHHDQTAARPRGGGGGGFGNAGVASALVNGPMSAGMAAQRPAGMTNGPPSWPSFTSDKDHQSSAMWRASAPFDNTKMTGSMMPANNVTQSGQEGQVIP